MPSNTMEYELAVVMPVYNEEECIVPVVRSWLDELSRLDINFLIFVLNDGSRDHTAERLSAFESHPRVEVINKENSGHGPTILMGYRLAVERADWVFQTDSDNEMKPGEFEQLWKRRDDYDALFGYRVNRRQTPDRRLISAFSRLTVRLFFGSGVRDVNTPYRLIRYRLLRQIVDQLPADTLTPNVIISGTLARAGARILNWPVPHESRQTGQVSIASWGLWKFACRAFMQCTRTKPRIMVHHNH